MFFHRIYTSPLQRIIHYSTLWSFSQGASKPKGNGSSVEESGARSSSWLHKGMHWVVPPRPVTVTARIIIFLVGDPYTAMQFFLTVSEGINMVNEYCWMYQDNISIKSQAFRRDDTWKKITFPGKKWRSVEKKIRSLGKKISSSAPLLLWSCGPLVRSCGPLVLWSSGKMYSRWRAQQLSK